MSTMALPLLLLIFAACAGVIWLAGVRLSDTTDVLDDRLHLGSAIGGVVLLAIATNLPEIAITVAAAASGHIGVAIGNILGGIAIQTLVLVALDAFGSRGAPTYRRQPRPRPGSRPGHRGSRCGDHGFAAAAVVALGRPGAGSGAHHAVVDRRRGAAQSIARPVAVA